MWNRKRIYPALLICLALPSLVLAGHWASPANVNDNGGGIADGRGAYRSNLGSIGQNIIAVGQSSTWRNESGFLHTINLGHGAPLTAPNTTTDKNNSLVKVEAYPNPMTEWVDFELTQAVDGPARVEICDLFGHVMQALEFGNCATGSCKIHWDGHVNGQRIANGTYAYRVVTSKNVAWGRIQVIW